MSASSISLPEFRNEPLTDFSVPAHRSAIEAALAKVRSEFGREYDLLIGGERVKTTEKLRSLNPSRPSEVVGIHQKATPELAARAVESAYASFAEWSATSASDRIRKLLAAAHLLRERKFEFDAWLVYEAGKTWPEADADTSEAIDFCEYYAREMLRLAGPQPVVQLPGEKDEMRYLPLGVGVIIPPWNFPLAILAGMTMAALVTGNTAVIKPSSETPTIAAKFAELLLEAGFPDRSFSFLPGSGSAIGDLLVQHPKTRFIAFTGSRDVGLRINELAAKPQPGQSLDQARHRRNGRQGRHHCGRATPTSTKPPMAYWPRRSATRGRSARPARAPSWTSACTTNFWPKLKKKAEALKVGPADDPGNYMGPVISEGARRTILQYIEAGSKEGTARDGRRRRSRRRLLHPAHGHRRRTLRAPVSFRKRSSGRCWR